MRTRPVLLLTALAAACGATSSSVSSGSASLAITGATVVHPGLDGAAAVETDRTVLIAGDHIVAVGPSASTPVPPGAQVVDGHGKWVIPGLVDSHVHFFQSANPFTRPDVVDFNDIVPYAKEVARNKARLPATFKVWLASRRHQRRRRAAGRSGTSTCATRRSAPTPRRASRSPAR